MRTTPTLVLAALSTASALVVQPMPTRTAVRVSGRSRDINCVASSSEDKALLAASQKVTLVAKRFGKEQGKAAQTWVEQAVKTGDASSDNLVQMQLALFEECKLDDGGKCADLSAAIDALTSAVDARKKGDSDVFQIISGQTPIQAAATKLRDTATRFGPLQKDAADAWIKKVTSGKATSAQGLLEEQITLFGECILSEDGTPSDCEELEKALSELQNAIDTCDVAKPEDCNPEEVVEELKAAAPAAPAPKAAAPAAAPAPPAAPKVSGRKRKAVKSFFAKLFGGGKVEMSPYAIASFLADPAAVDAELKGMSIDELAAGLEKAGVSAGTISHARVSVLPYLPGQEAPGGPSLEAEWNLSPWAVASFFAAPEKVDMSFRTKSPEELAQLLQAEGVSADLISHARTSVLPYLPGQIKPGVDSTERP